MKIFTYLIKSVGREWYYTGISNNPERRLIEHNFGKQKATAKNKPYILIYSKAHDSYDCARKHEKYLKKKNLEYKRGLASKIK